MHWELPLAEATAPLGTWKTSWISDGSAESGVTSTSARWELRDFRALAADPRVLLLSYEQMKADLPACVARVAAHLGLAPAPELLQKIWILRKLLHGMEDLPAIEFQLDKLKDTKSNEEFFKSMKRK